MAGIVHSSFKTRAQVVPALALALLLSACSTTSSLQAPTPGAPLPETMPVTPEMAVARAALSQMVALQDRLYKVAAPLLINNADLCKTQARNLLGFTAKNKFSYPGEYADAAQAVLGYGDRLQVSNVLAGSGAARADLRKGDGLIAAEGQTLPTGPDAETGAAEVLGPLVGKRTMLKMTIARGLGNQVLNVPITRACAFRVELGNADNVNAYADGQRLMLTRGMISFAQTDTAIAYVMAKEMAHNMLGHANAQQSTATLGSIIDNLATVQPDLTMLIGSAGVKPMPRHLDAAADRLAIYLLARAGYNIDQAARFWQRLASQHPATVSNGHTANHPATAYRIAAINKAVAEVKAKRASGKALLP
jgi:hypothetical protein